MHCLIGAVAIAATMFIPVTQAQEAVQGPGRWAAGRPMPAPRAEIAAAEAGGRIYVIGGFGGERTIAIYDPATDRWSEGAAFPHAIHHPSAAGVNGRIYVFGGYVGDWQPGADAQEYDPAQDRWRT